jgi:hypothetical protein
VRRICCVEFFSACKADIKMDVAADVANVLSSIFGKALISSNLLLLAKPFDWLYKEATQRTIIAGAMNTTTSPKREFPC